MFLKNNLYYIIEKRYVKYTVHVRFSITFYMMGLQCSKQGSHRFENYAEKRVVPEGEYDTLKLATSTFPDEISKTFSISNEFSHKQESFKNLMGCNEQKWSTMVSHEEVTLVDLPPEGQVENNDKYVEVPFEKENLLHEKKNLTVELSEDTDGFSFTNDRCSSSNSSMFVSERQSKSSRSSIFSTQFKESETSDSAETDRWTYTLYDFQGRGIVSKQDFRHLIETVYNTVNHDSKHKDSLGHSLKVHVEIERKRNVNESKSSKYTPSKICKGMIFPPPNTEEAEKISNYIEERLHQHRTYSKAEHNCSSESSTSNCLCCDMTSNCSCYSKKCCCRSRRYYENNVMVASKNVKGPNRLVESNITMDDLNRPSLSEMNMYRHSQTSRSSKHSSSCRFNRKHRMETNKPPNLSESRADMDKNDLVQFRIKHSCSSHRRLRENKLKLTPFSIKDSDFNVGEERKKSRKNNNKSNPFFNTKCEDLFSSELTKSSSKTLKNNLPSYSRPPVWPGECSSDQTSPTRKKKQSIETRYRAKDDVLCICKRMLGANYPCHLADYPCYFDKCQSSVGNSIRQYHSFIPAL